MAMTVAKFRNTADGVEAEVWQTEADSFSVLVWDTDAKQQLRTHRVFSILALAIAYAKRIAGVES